MVQELRQSTAVVVHIGVCVAVGDGFTPVTTLSLSAADEAEVLKHAATTTTSISGLTFTAITSCDGWFRLSLGTGETNTLGMMEVIIQDDSLCLPIQKQFMVLTANAWDSKYGTDVRNVDVTQLNGVTQSLLDLKKFADDAYNPATDKISGVVLVDTTTTNTDVRGTDSAALASVCTEARLLALDGANLPTDVAAVKADTAAILVDTADMQPKIGAPATDLAADIAAVKTEADKIALADAGAGVAGSVIEEVENRALASVCTEPRLAELDAANLQTDVAAVKTDTTAILVDTADMQPKIGAPATDLAADIAAVPTATENADGLLDRANGIETSLTLREALRLVTASVAGKLSGAQTTTILIRNAVADDKTRITATVDASENRTAFIYDVT